MLERGVASVRTDSSTDSRIVCVSMDDSEESEYQLYVMTATTTEVVGWCGVTCVRVCFCCEHRVRVRESEAVHWVRMCVCFVVSLQERVSASVLRVI